jgi:hypothetical protein
VASERLISPSDDLVVPVRPPVEVACAVYNAFSIAMMILLDFFGERRVRFTRVVLS